jgi:hypothetical protein
MGGVPQLLGEPAPRLSNVVSPVRRHDDLR